MRLAEARRAAATGVVQATPLLLPSSHAAKHKTHGRLARPAEGRAERRQQTLRSYFLLEHGEERGASAPRKEMRGLLDSALGFHCEVNPRVRASLGVLMERGSFEPFDLRVSPRNVSPLLSIKRFG